MKKFIVQCSNEKCKKVILKENSATKFRDVFGRKPEPGKAWESISAVDPETKEPVVLPNVWCKHCKTKNLITDDSFQFTNDLDLTAKKKLDSKIKDDVKKAKNTDGEVEAF